jgi:hypothetical protein
MRYTITATATDAKTFRTSDDKTDVEVEATTRAQAYNGHFFALQERDLLSPGDSIVLKES